MLDQKGCSYTPRVFGIQVGQSLDIVNSDETLHNIHALPMANREFNRGQALQGPEVHDDLHDAGSHAAVQV